MTLCHFAECRCAVCHDLFIVKLNVIMLSAVAPFNKLFLCSNFAYLLIFLRGHSWPY